LLQPVEVSKLLLCPHLDHLARIATAIAIPEAVVATHIPASCTSWLKKKKEKKEVTATGKTPQALAAAQIMHAGTQLSIMKKLQASHTPGMVCSTLHER